MVYNFFWYALSLVCKMPEIVGKNEKSNAKKTSTTKKLNAVNRNVSSNSVTHINIRRKILSIPVFHWLLSCSLSWIRFFFFFSFVFFFFFCQFLFCMLRVAPTIALLSCPRECFFRLYFSTFHFGSTFSASVFINKLPLFRISFSISFAFCFCFCCIQTPWGEKRTKCPLPHVLWMKDKRLSER